MNWPRIVLCGLLGMLVVAACNRPSRQGQDKSDSNAVAELDPLADAAETVDESADETASSVATDSSPSAEPAEINTSEDLVTDAGSDIEVDPNADTTDANAVSEQQAVDDTEATTDSAEPEREMAEPERVIVLAEIGPIVIDVYLYMDEQTYRDRIDVLIDDVLQVGDENEDGQTTWKELTSSKQFVYGQYGNPQVDSEQQRIELVKAYDINRNKYVDRDEVLGFLRQDSSNSQIFYLNEAGDDADGVTTSPVFQWLDTNSDGLLDESERSSAPVRIWKNDTEDDRIIRADDFAPNANNSMVVNRRRSRRTPRKTLVPKEYSDWSKLLYALEEKYAYGNPLTVHDLPEFAEFFTLLDGDQDEYLSPREFSEVMNVPPHLKLAVSFGANAEQKIRVDHVQPGLPFDSVSVNGNRLQLALADSLIELTVSEPPINADVDQQIAAVFERSDTDKDDAISEEEFATLSGFAPIPFAAVDANQDNKVDRDELQAAIVNRQLAQSSQIAGNVGSNRQPLFGQLDINGDGQLMAREVDQIPERLELLDENEDGVISANERPNSIAISLTRGVAANQFIASPSAAQPLQVNVSGPSWFRSMDVNNDGEISQREFLGPIETFEQLDTDGDQFVSLAEAVAE